jgi:primosomal protein N' (replication factor Y) (superfamily II helicase)
MLQEQPKYADIILPLAVPQYYTYKIPSELADSIKVGSRVTVPLGKRRIFTGIIRKVHNHPPTVPEIKDIISILDNFPLINPTQISFWEWLADYYMCTTGEVMKAALPAGLKLESETRVFPNEITDYSILTATEQSIFDLIEDVPGISIQKLNNTAGKKDLMPVIRNLVEKGFISTEENLKENYKPKIREYLKLANEWKDEAKFSDLMNQIEKRAPKQARLVMQFLHLRGFEKEDPELVPKEKLVHTPDFSQATLTTILKKNILKPVHVETSRLSENLLEVRKPNALNNKQSKAFVQIKDLFNEKDIVLLHGVTSSGKTEIYIHLIEEAINSGKQVLYLLPEIALTAQMINRLKSVFGDKIGVYHSKFTDAERVEVYQNLTGIKKEGSPDYQVILGVRSSLFLPFSRLGLVIVDEEHENTYKQYDPAPRYNARDAAIVLAGMHKAKVLMGTATPSFESYFNAQAGKYGLVELNERYLDIQLPEIQVVNVREERRKKLMKTIFSPDLIDEISDTLANKEQVILFQNRRGFSPYIECVACGTIPYCINCDVSLTYHKASNRLHCHYCGYSIPNPHHCASCGSNNLQTRGFGTEKVEDEISILFPGAKAARMDLDTTRTRKSYERIIEDFENRKIDILIGTQMVSKGLDFDHVKVVGILNADNMLNFPDFRSYERSFQLIAQVSGRAGRKNKRGKVIIQTGYPEQVVIKHLIDNDYKGFYSHQLAERAQFNYPPYFRLVKLTLRHKKLLVVAKAAEMLAAELRKVLGNRIIGPEFPLINRMFSLHQKCIIVKAERDMHFAERRMSMRTAIEKIASLEEFKSLQIVPDVDPYN